ncbi:MAG TPA: PqqD family protein [Acidobacteria bacterium]|nr:PqqD family protein [Acidobacteriota bacterium]
MNRELKPLARQEKLVIREMASGETIIYDVETNEAHCLNRTSALVWAQCDGQKGVAEIASAVTTELDEPFSEELVQVALAELEDAGLLEEMPVQLQQAAVLTRRQAMDRIGKGALIATLIPLITTIMTPTPAAAGSCRPAGASCTSGFQCCSGYCNAGTCA